MGFIIATDAGAGFPGLGAAEVDFSTYYGVDRYAQVQYVSLVGPVGSPPPDDGGCPFLSVFDGSLYVPEGILDIHANSDVVCSRILTTAPAVVNGMYLLRLAEHPLTISHIDQVKLYANLGGGRTIQLPLVSAIHSQYGNVLPQLLFDDGWRIDELGAKWNNGTSQSIDLRFLALPPALHPVSFTFVIDGYNPVKKY